MQRLIDSPIPSPPGFVVWNAGEDLFPGCGIEPDPKITDRHHHVQLTAVLRADDEVTSPALNRPHRIDGIQNQV